MPTFTEAANCESLLSEIDNPSIAERLFCLTSLTSLSVDYYACTYAQISLANVKNVKIMLNVIANKNIDNNARIYILKTILSDYHIRVIANNEGAINICIDIIKDNESSEDLIDAAIELLHGIKFYNDKLQLIEILKGFIHDIEYGNENLKISSAKILVSLTGWRFSTRNVAYKTKDSPVYMLTSEIGAIESICNALKTCDSLKLTNQLCNLITAIACNNRTEGFSIFTDLGIVDILLNKLDMFKDTVECRPILTSLQEVSMTETGQDEILNSSLDIEKLFKHLLRFEKAEVMDVFNEKGQFTCLIFRILSRLSFSPRIAPLVLENVLIFDNDKTIFWLGNFMRQSLTGAILTRDKAYEIINFKIIKKELFTIGELSLLQGFLTYCEMKYVDVLIDLDIHNLLLTLLKTSNDEDILLWAWRCILQLCKGSLTALKTIYSSEIVSFLPSSIEKGSMWMFDTCCDTVIKILSVEEGALKLPLTLLLNSLATRLSISDEFFQNSYTPDDSPFPDAVKAATVLTSLVTKQPPQTIEKVREEVFTSLFDQVWNLLVRIRSCGIYYFRDTTKFMELLKSLQKCKQFKALQSSRLDRLLSAQTNESDVWNESFFFFMFSISTNNSTAEESIDDSIAEEKLSHILMDSSFGSKLTSERRGHILYTMSSNLLSKKVKSKFSQRPIFDSVIQILNSGSNRDTYEVVTAIELIVTMISNSSNDITDMIISKKVVSCMFSFYESSQDKLHCTPHVISFVNSLLEKAYKTGEVKITEVALVLLETNILQILEPLVRESRELLLYPAALTVLGYLLSTSVGVTKLEPILHDMSFTQLLKICGSEEGQVAILRSEKTLNRVLDTIRSSSEWESLVEYEKNSVLALLKWFACFKSPYKSNTLVSIPEVLELTKKYLSLLSTASKAVVCNALGCITSWFISFCDTSGLACSDVVKLLVHVVISSYKVCKTSRFSEIKAIISSCLSAKSSSIDLFVRELVSTIIACVSTSSSRLAVLQLLYQIYPNDTSLLMKKSKTVFVELGGLEVLLDRVSVSPLDRTRLCCTYTSYLVGNILQCEVGMKKFDEMNGSNIITSLLKDEVNVPQQYLWVLLIYVFDTSWSGCTSLLNEGFLEMLTPVAREGSESKGFFFAVQMLQLISYRGSDEHRNKIVKSDACQLTVKCLIDGTIGSNQEYQLRISYLMGYSINYNPKVKKYTLDLLDSFDISNTKLTLSAIEKLSKICASQCSEYFEFLQANKIGSRLLPFYEHEEDSTFRQSDRECVSSFIVKLVKFIPHEFTTFSKALSKQLQTRLLNMETPTNEAIIISYMARTSHNAKALIVSSLNRIFGDFDSGNEQFACIILSILQSFCDSNDGMSVLMESGVAVDILTQTLAIARTADMKVGVLKVLSKLSTEESNRIKLNCIVEPVFHILTSYVHMELIESDQSMPTNTAETQKQTFPLDFFISHDWGVDEMNRNTHARVSKINSLLQASGCKTWFDDEQMRGSINSKMAKGIAESAVFAVFLTNNYIKKASGLGSKGEDDNCFFEFDTAVLERGRSNMIAVVLEPSCRDTSKWAAGVVKGKLGTKLYIDLSANEDDDSFHEGITKLLREISTLTGKTYGDKPIVESTKGAGGRSTGELSKLKYKDVAYSTNDLKIASEAMNLLYCLSLSESNRSAFESIGDPLISYMEYLCESKVLGSPNFQGLAILANVYGPYIDLPVHSDDTIVRNNRVRECLKSYDYFNVVYGLTKQYGRDSKGMKSSLLDTHGCFICISNMAYIEEFRSHELISSYIEDLIRIVNEGNQSLVRMEAVHKIIACEILTRCCKSDECRTMMISLGAERLARSINTSVRADDENEDNARLWFSSKQTIDALSGDLDASSEESSSWLKASQLIQDGTITETDISAIPTYQTFISYKRSSAQDFARLLHSMITGTNLTCCLDVENLDRIDMLSLLVAGSDVFICVLSDDVFKSLFWKQELSYAVKAGIPIILVVKDGSRFPDTYGQLTESFPSYELLDKEFIGEYEHCKDVFKQKAIQHSNEYFRSFSVNLLRKIENCLEEVNEKYENSLVKKDAITKRRKAIVPVVNVITDSNNPKLMSKKRDIDIQNTSPLSNKPSSQHGGQRVQFSNSQSQSIANLNPNPNPNPNPPQQYPSQSQPQSPQHQSPQYQYQSQSPHQSQPQSPQHYQPQSPQHYQPQHHQPHSPHQHQSQSSYQSQPQLQSPHQHQPQSSHEYQPPPSSRQYQLPQSPHQYHHQYNSQPHHYQSLGYSPYRTYNPSYNPLNSSQTYDSTPLPPPPLQSSYNELSSAPGLLGIDMIKQMFDIDHATPVLEVLRIAEKMLGVNINGEGPLPMRVQVIKSALGFP